jgi:murein hydrolase activator
MNAFFSERNSRGMRDFFPSSFLCVGLLLLLLQLPFGAAGQSRKELEGKKKKLQKEIELTNELLSETKSTKTASLSQLKALKKKINLREELIRTIAQELNMIDQQIARSNKTIDGLSSELKKLKEEYARMVYYAYKNRNAYDRMMFLFSSKDFNQAYQRLKYMQQYTEYRHHQAQLIQSAQSNLNKKIQELEEKKEEKKNLLTSEELEKQNLDAEKKEQEGIVKDLESREDELREDLEKKRRDAKKLENAIKHIIAEEIRRQQEEIKRHQKELQEEKERREREQEKLREQAKNNKKGKLPNKKNVPQKEEKPDKTPVTKELELTPEAKELSNSFEANKGKLPWPVAHGDITEEFGVRPHPTLKDVEVSNNGIDISTQKAADVRALFNGEVTAVVSLPGAGKFVIVRHGEYLTVYAHLEEVFVKVKEKVSTKQVIGKVMINDEGKSELHLEIWKGQVLLDPELWIHPKM